MTHPLLTSFSDNFVISEGVEALKRHQSVSVDDP
jgi:hypothetical protein